MPEEDNAQQDPNTLSLEAREHGKIGAVHCGVTREGLVSIRGRQYPLDDGKTAQDEASGIAVARQGEQYTFTRA